MLKKTDTCPGCGAQIMKIKTPTAYGRLVVDAEPVWIRLQYGGNMYVQKDGEVVFGYRWPEMDPEEDPDSNLVEVYSLHRGHCPTGGRAPRIRRRRTR